MDTISSNNAQSISTLISSQSALNSADCELIVSCSKMSGIIEKIIPGSTPISCSDFNVHTRDAGCSNEDIVSRFESSAQAFSEKIKQSFIGSGNYCGHDPKVIPEVARRPNQKFAPLPFIDKVMKRLDQAYKRPKYYLRSVNIIRNRQTRSEMRAAIIALSKALMNYFCMETSVIGHYSKKGYFWGPEFKKIVASTNIKPWRLERARSFMVKHQLLWVTTRERRGPDGRYQSLPALYQFTPLFFVELGWNLKDLWRYKDSYIRNKRKKKGYQSDDQPLPSPWPKAQTQRSRPPIIMSGPRPIIENVSKERTNLSLDTEETVQQKQALIAKAIQMNKNDPSKSISEYHALLRNGPPH